MGRGGGEECKALLLREYADSLVSVKLIHDEGPARVSGVDGGKEGGEGVGKSKERLCC